MNRILVAYDGRAPARRALDTAIQLASSSEDAVVGVVSVVPFRPGQHGMPVDRVEVTDAGDLQIEPVHMRDVWEAEAETTDALIQATRILERAGIRAEIIKPWGDPALAIERVAEDGAWDVIVIGTRDLGRVAEFSRAASPGTLRTMQTPR